MKPSLGWSAGLKPVSAAAGMNSAHHVAVDALLAGDLQLAGPHRVGVFAGPIDQQLIGHRLGRVSSAAGRQEDEAMAEAAGAVNVVRVARVDPELQAVAVFELALAAPARMPLAFDAHAEGQARLAPGGPHVGQRLLAFQLAQRRQPVLRRKFRRRAAPSVSSCQQGAAKRNRNRVGSSGSAMAFWKGFFYHERHEAKCTMIRNMHESSRVYCVVAR